MAKKKASRKAPRNEKEWKQWGKRVGRKFEKFGKDIEPEAKEFGERVGKNAECCGGDWMHPWAKKTDEGVFGFLSPLIGAIAAVVVLLAIVIISNIVNSFVGSTLISELTGFIAAKLHWFFAAFLVFNFSKYFSKRLPFYWVAEPAVCGLAAGFLAWVLAWLCMIFSGHAARGFFLPVSGFLFANLYLIAIVVAIIGYALLPFKRACCWFCKLKN